MAHFVLCSASGAPGATVTALGLTLTWPRDVLLVDADRTPAQAVLAGYLRGTASYDRGLPGVLQAHRERRPLLDAIPEVSLPLPEPPPGRRAQAAPGPSRRFLPGFSHLGAIDVFNTVWRDFGEALQAASFDVITDAGRLGSHGLPTGLADTATVAVVCRTSLVSLAGLRPYLAVLADQVPPDRLGLLLVGTGRPYRANEVAEQFGVPVLGEVAWTPAAAAELQEGQPLSPRWRRQPLARSLAAIAAHLTASRDAERLSVGAPR